MTAQFFPGIDGGGTIQCVAVVDTNLAVLSTTRVPCSDQDINAQKEAR